jgi:signal peptidase I
MLARLRAAAISLIALVLVVPVLLPVVTGHRLIVVDGASMSPTFEIGDVLLTAAPTGDDLEVGRIVVVGEPGALYTHRVLEVDRDGADVRARLQGDANTVPDPGWVHQREVFAVYETHVAGLPAVLLRGAITPPGTLVLLAIAVVLLLIGAGGAALRPARRSRRSPQRADPQEEPVP